MMKPLFQKKRFNIHVFTDAFSRKTIEVAD